MVPGGAANQWRCAVIMIDILKRAWIAVSGARIWYAGSGLPSHQPRLESNIMSNFKSNFNRILIGFQLSFNWILIGFN